MIRPSLGRRVVAEATGTALLLATVVGSGIMAERLSGGNVALALLANALATGAGLVALILTFGGVSGAHFNPVVTAADASQREGGLAWRDVLPYVVAQIAGAFAGVALAHTMFDLPLFSTSTHVRAGTGQLVAELTATFGLVSVIKGCSRSAFTPFAVAAYIIAAYWFTSSTSFANPAVTLARAASNTFAGIRPADAPAFIVAQVLGAAAASVLFRWLLPSRAARGRALTTSDEENAA